MAVQEQTSLTAGENAVVKHVHAAETCACNRNLLGPASMLFSGNKGLLRCCCFNKND